MMRILCFFALLGLISFSACADASLSDDDIAAVLKDLKSKNAGIRTAAARDVGRIGAVRAADAKEAIPLLLNMVKKDKDASARKTAVEALGRIDPDPKEVVPVLIEALKDKDANVRQAVATALGQFPSEATDIVPALRDTEKDKNKMVERAAKMSLRNLREQKKP
jgi:HEAT repeat protein